MNATLIAAELARRIPEMARDSVVNNEAVILRMLTEEKPQERENRTVSLLDLLVDSSCWQKRFAAKNKSEQ